MPNAGNVLLHGTLADIARDHPLTYFDVGARGGFQDDLCSLAGAVDVVGFEPDPEAFAAMAGALPNPWRSVSILPAGISASGGRQALHIARDPISSSLLPPIVATGATFDKPQFFDIIKTIEVETITLAEAFQQSGRDHLDYLKIDIEGAELDVLQASSGPLLDGLLAVKTEVAFIPMRDGGALAAELDAFMRENGFVLMRLMEPAHWRRHGYEVHPLVGREHIPYARGQLAQGDYLYLRDPATLAYNVEALVRLALLMMALGYFDHALMALEGDAPKKYLRETYEIDPRDLVAVASKRYAKVAVLRALKTHLRELSPFLRALWRAFVR